MTLTYLLCPQILILKSCRLYNVFGSGANHAIYAQFMAQSFMANKGRKVGLLRGTGTRMALWFYAMMRVLRLKQALMATIHQQRFTNLTVNETVAMAVQDIENPDFWKCCILYCVLYSPPFVCFVTVISPSLLWTKYITSLTAQYRHWNSRSWC